MKESTASPRYSSRSLWSAPWLRCVSARSSRPGSDRSTPSRSASQLAAGCATVIGRSARADVDRLVEVHEERDVAGDRGGRLVGGAHGEFAPVPRDLDVVR